MLEIVYKADIKCEHPECSVSDTLTCTRRESPALYWKGQGWQIWPNGETFCVDHHISGGV